MKKFLTLLVFIPTAALASPPFKYKTPCYLESNNAVQEDVCTVVETRTDKGFINTRNIYSNKWGLTIKMRWKNDQEGFMTWDSHNKFEYKWEYKTGTVPNKSEPHTYVMPGIMLESVSWD